MENKKPSEWPSVVLVIFLFCSVVIGSLIQDCYCSLYRNRAKISQKLKEQDVVPEKHKDLEDMKQILHEQQFK